MDLHRIARLIYKENNVINVHKIAKLIYSESTDIKDKNRVLLDELRELLKREGDEDIKEKDQDQDRIDELRELLKREKEEGNLENLEEEPKKKEPKKKEPKKKDPEEKKDPEYLDDEDVLDDLEDEKEDEKSSEKKDKKEKVNEDDDEKYEKELEKKVKELESEGIKILDQSKVKHEKAGVVTSNFWLLEIDFKKEKYYILDGEKEKPVKTFSFKEKDDMIKFLKKESNNILEKEFKTGLEKDESFLGDVGDYIFDAIF